MNPLTPNERAVLNNLQGGFPVSKKPFEDLEDQVGLPADTILATVKKLDNADLLSRFGAVLNTRAMGGDSRLAAMSVPEQSLEEVATTVNGYRTVTHNYVRNHDLNLWFVLSARSADRIDSTMDTLESETGHTVFDLPKLTEYYVGLQFEFHEDGSVRTVSVDEDYGRIDERKASQLTADQRDLVRGIQEGLPLTARPYSALGERIEFPESRTLEVTDSLLREGKIKRLGCVPNHYALGIQGNGMAVFDVPEDRIDEVGERLGQRDEVTHCYRRPRHRPYWPYNLFAMVHDRTRERARSQIAELRTELNITDFPHDILFSERMLKKTGLRLNPTSKD